MGFSSDYLDYFHYSDGMGYLIFVAIVLPPVWAEILLIHCNRENHKRRPFDNISKFCRIIHVLRHVPSLRPVKRQLFDIIEDFIQLDALSLGNFSDDLAQQISLSYKTILSAPEIAFIEICNQRMLSIFEFKYAGDFFPGLHLSERWKTLYSFGGFFVQNLLIGNCFKNWS